MNVDFESLPVRKIISVFLIITYILLIAGTIILINKKSYTQLPESLASTRITINDTSNKLYLSTIKDDYNAFLYRLQNYITYQDGNPNAEVVIKAVDVPKQEETLYKVTLDIPSLKQTNLVATFDYAANNFSIPSKSYILPLYTESN